MMCNWRHALSQPRKVDGVVYDRCHPANRIQPRWTNRLFEQLAGGADLVEVGTVRTPRALRDSAACAPVDHSIEDGSNIPPVALGARKHAQSMTGLTQRAIDSQGFMHCCATSAPRRCQHSLKEG